MKKKKVELSTEEKIDKVLLHLEHLDKRDRLRTWGGLVKGLVSIVPVLAFIYGLWYFSQNGDAFLEKIAKTAAEQAAAVTTQGTNSIMEQLKNFQVQ